MSRERIARVILRAYPPEITSERGEEILSTLLDAGDESSRAFARECGSLALAGIRERAAKGAQLISARLVGDAFRLAAVLWMVIRLSGISAAALGYPPGVQGFVLWLLFLWPILGVFLLGHERLAGLCGIAWIVTLQLPIALGPYPDLIAGSIVPLGGFVVMVFARRDRRHDSRRLAWLLPVFGLSVLAQPFELTFGTFGVVALTIISAAGLLVLVSDPRVLLACALVWASIGMVYAAQALLLGQPPRPAVALIASLPLAAVTAVLRLRTIRRRQSTW
jgi:hypothetical protein